MKHSPSPLRSPALLALFLFCALASTAPAASSSLWLGYTEPLRTTQMAFAEIGIVTAIYVKQGDVVKEGDLLARLNTAILEEEQKIVQEQLNLQELRLQRLRNIIESGRPLSPDELERAEADFRIEELRVSRLQAQINNRSLFAPFPGIVTQVHRELGESSSGTDTTIITLVQLHQLQVYLHLPPAIIDGMQVGDTLPLQLDDGRQVTGEIAFISPTIDAASNTLRVRILIDNENNAYRSGQGCRLLRP